MSDEKLKSLNNPVGHNKDYLTSDLIYKFKGLTWSNAWKITSFKWKFWIGMLVFASILTALPYFFDAIENRNGRFFSDWVLLRIPSHDVSVAVFILIWSSFILLLIRTYKDPMMWLVMLWAYNGVTLLRMACISLISLNPPAGLIPLADPIISKFYGKHYITHDLFFSGHTTSVFLIFLCLKKKSDRIYALFASVLLGVLLLVQHVHYLVDVLAAPLFTYGIYLVVLRFTKRENQSGMSDFHTE